MEFDCRRLPAAALVLFVGTTSLWAKSRTIEDYPLKVQIIDVNWDSNTHGGWNGIGHGNLSSPAGDMKGFEFNASCSKRFMPTTGNHVYPARWKKEQASLALRTTEVGNDNKHEECEIKVSLSDDLYTYRNGQLETITQAQLQAMRQKQEAAKQAQTADLDPTHYPLQFKLMKADWTPANPGFSGSGRGDLRFEDKSVKGIEFTVQGQSG
jgi:hypothetical protein